MTTEERLHLESILKERHHRIIGVLSKNNTKEQSKEIKDIETWCKTELKKIDKEYARSCYPE